MFYEMPDKHFIDFLFCIFFDKFKCKLLRNLIGFKTTICESNTYNMILDMDTYPLKKHYSPFEYIYFFSVIWFLGSGTVFTKNSLESFALDLEGNAIIAILGKLMMILLTFLLLVKKKIPISCTFNYKIVVILLLWAILQYCKYHIFSFFSIMRLMNLFFAITIARIYKHNIIYLYEEVVSKFSFISLIGWGLVLIIPDFMLFIGQCMPIAPYGLVTESFGVFGIADSFEFARRNLGFAWEPGRFGAIVSVALFFNVIINRFRIKNNKNFWILVLAIVSSQSTTAYAALVFIFCFYMYNKRRKYIIKLLLFFLLLLIAFFSLDFMWNKIINLWITEEHLEKAFQEYLYYESNDAITVPQRFDGLYFELLNIINDPLIGNASNPVVYLKNLFGITFSLSNGCLRIFANMGILIGIVYYIMAYKSSAYLAHIFRYKMRIAYLALFIFVNISYSFIFEPIFLSIILMPIYINKKPYAEPVIYNNYSML